MPELTKVSEAIEHNARATEAAAKASRQRFAWLYGAVAVLTVAMVLGGLFFQNRTSDALRTAQLGFEQSKCFNILQGHYIKQIGLLADSNGASLRGETPDPARNRARVVELRKASEYVDAVERICYTETPDPSPLDGILPDGTVVVVP